MSYDIEIGTAEPPPHEAIVAWAQQSGQTLDDGWFGNLFRISGPAPARRVPAGDRAACEAPRWRTILSVPFSAPDDAVELAVELAVVLALAHQGAALDVQARDAAVAARGRADRPAPHRELDVSVG